MKKLLLILVLLVSGNAIGQTGVTVVDFEYNSDQYYLFISPGYLNYDAPDSSLFTIDGVGITGFRDDMKTIIHNGSTYTVNGVDYTAITNIATLYESHDFDVPWGYWGNYLPNTFGWTSFLVKTNTDGSRSKFRTHEINGLVISFGF